VRTQGDRFLEETAVPIGFLTDAERERLDGFPARVVPGDLDAYFTLSRADRRQVPRTTSAANRLGFALQLGTLRFLGFCPDDLNTAPEAVVAFVAKQLDVPRASSRVRPTELPFGTLSDFRVRLQNPHKPSKFTVNPENP